MLTSLLTRSCVAVVVSTGLVAAEPFPATWDQAAGNPHTTAPWSLERLWPVDGKGLGPGVPLTWQESLWRADAHAQGNMPSIQVIDGTVRLTAGGSWGAERDFLKIPAVTYRVTTAGAYGIAGRANVRAFSGQAQAEVRLLHRRQDAVSALRSWSVAACASRTMRSPPTSGLTAPWATARTTTPRPSAPPSSAPG